MVRGKKKDDIDIKPLRKQLRDAGMPIDHISDKNLTIGIIKTEEALLKLGISVQEVGLAFLVLGKATGVLTQILKDYLEAVNKIELEKEKEE